MPKIETKTLDAIYKPKTEYSLREKSKLQNTVIEMIEDFDDIKNDKVSRIKAVKDLYQEAIDGLSSTRANQSPSLLLNILLKIYATLTQVPDTSLDIFGVRTPIVLVMTKYLDNLIEESGFKELMEQDFGGYKQQFLYGDFFIFLGKDLDDNKAMPIFRGLPISNLYTQKSANRIRSKTAGRSMTRLGVVYEYGVEEAENLFPGIMDYAYAGSLPRNQREWSPDDEKDLIQKTAEEEARFIEIMFFYDISNRDKPIYSILAGKNMYEYSTVKGKQYPFWKKVRGKSTAILPIEKFTYSFTPDGIFGRGGGEMFLKITNILSKLNNAEVNNVIDRQYRPTILNIDKVNAKSLFKQLKDARTLKDKGEQAYIVPELAKKDKESGGVLGQMNVSSIAPEPIMQEGQLLKQELETMVRRMGINIDYNFADPKGRVAITEQNIRNTNESIEEIHRGNLESYKFIYEFMIDCIVEYGDENDTTPFAYDIELELATGKKKLSEMTVDGQPITVTNGEIVTLFKKYADLIQVNVDVSTGTRFNTLLEERNLLKQLQFLQPGTKAHTDALKSFGLLFGKSYKDDDFGLPQAEGMQALPQAQQAQALLSE